MRLLRVSRISRLMRLFRLFKIAKMKKLGGIIDTRLEFAFKIHPGRICYYIFYLTLRYWKDDESICLTSIPNSLIQLFSVHDCNLHIYIYIS